MYHVATALQVPIVDWIQEFAAFPLFAKVGGMPYPKDNPTVRAQTIRRTIRLMRDQNRSLLLFAESELHRPPQLLGFGRSLQLISDTVPDAKIFPVAIRYDMSLHERPEAFITIGQPVEPGPDLSVRTRLQVGALLDVTMVKMEHDPGSFEMLQRGTLDVNERWDVRRFEKQK